MEKRNMGIILWIIFGAIAGGIAGAIVGGGKRGLIKNIIIGILGANIGGFLATKLFGWDGISGFNLHSMLIAIAGACVLLLVSRFIAN